jgi:hypothetical protein
MNLEQAYIEGFVKRAAEYGFSQHEAVEIFKRASELKGDQHKLDVDKDGKIEGSDLKKLRQRKQAADGFNPLTAPGTPDTQIMSSLFNRGGAAAPSVKPQALAPSVKPQAPTPTPSSAVIGGGSAAASADPTMNEKIMGFLGINNPNMQGTRKSPANAYGGVMGNAPATAAPGRK